MGFLRRLFGGPTKSDKPSPSSSTKTWHSRRSFIKSLDGGRNRLTLPPEGNGVSYGNDSGPNKHDIAVAVAEAVFANAQPASEVVRLTGGGGGRGYLRVHELAAVNIQSAFRGFL